MFNLILGLLAVMAGNILLGSTLATLKETFSKDVFWNGVLKCVFIAAGCCLMYLASWLNPDIFAANIAGVDVNLIGGMKLLFTAGIALYGGACLIKLKDMLGLKINVAAVVEGEAETDQASGTSNGTNVEEAQLQDGVAAAESLK